MKVTIMLGKMVLFLMILGGASCIGAPSAENSGNAVKKEGLSIISAAKEEPLPLDSYFAVASIYRGLFEPLSLDLQLNLEEKWEIISALYFRSPLLDELKGGAVDKEAPGKMEIQDFYETGDALEILFCRFSDPYRLEWMSNCIHSPIVKGPLLGRGEFIGNQGQVYNYGDTILLAQGRPLRFVEIEQCQRYLDGLVELDSIEKGDPSEDVSDTMRMNGTLILLEGGRTEDREVVERYLDSLEQTIPVRLIKAEWALASGDYEKATRFLDEVEESRLTRSEGEQRILQNFRDRYQLQQRLDGKVME